jgi:hypothetical protein
MSSRRPTLPPIPFDPNDPVLRRREQIRSLVKIGKTVGYALFAAAIAAFAVARLDGPRPIYTQILALTMGIGSLFLAPAIVFGYAIGAAERDDRQRAAMRAERAAAAERSATEAPRDPAEVTPGDT